MKRALLWLLLASALTPLVAGAQSQPLTIIGLHHRSAEEVVPLLRPFVAAGGTLAGSGQQLFIRTTPRNLAELRRLLRTIDRAPHQLLITVRQGAAAEQIEQASNASGSITVGGHGYSGAARLRIYGTEGRNEANDIQQVRVLEGNPAVIRMGQAVPVGNRSIARTPYGDQTTDSITYRNITTGLTVVPHITGDGVSLEIIARRQVASDSGGGRVNIQRIHTTVAGKLGQWLDIGGVVTRQQYEENGIEYRRTAPAPGYGKVLLKVEEIR